MDARVLALLLVCGAALVSARTGSTDKQDAELDALLSAKGPTTGMVHSDEATLTFVKGRVETAHAARRLARQAVNTPKAVVVQQPPKTAPAPHVPANLVGQIANPSAMTRVPEMLVTPVLSNVRGGVSTLVNDLALGNGLTAVNAVDNGHVVPLYDSGFNGKNKTRVNRILAKYASPPDALFVPPPVSSPQPLVDKASVNLLDSLAKSIAKVGPALRRLSTKVKTLRANLSDMRRDFPGLARREAGVVVHAALAAYRARRRAQKEAKRVAKASQVKLAKMRLRSKRKQIDDEIAKLAADRAADMERISAEAADEAVKKLRKEIEAREAKAEHEMSHTDESVKKMTESFESEGKKTRRKLNSEVKKARHAAREAARLVMKKVSASLPKVFRRDLRKDMAKVKKLERKLERKMEKLNKEEKRLARDRGTMFSGIRTAQPDPPTVTPITKKEEPKPAQEAAANDNDSLLEEANAEALIRRLDEQRKILHQQ